MQYHYISDKELYHFGRSKKDGAKVGSGRYPLGSGKAANYSTTQRTRDRKIYGKGSERRINKRMLKGESIQSARHSEVVRKDRIKAAKKIGKTIAIGAVAGVGAFAVNELLKSKGLSGVVLSEASKAAVDLGKVTVRAMFDYHLIG